MKKTGQPDMNEGIKNEESLIFSEEYAAPVGEITYIHEVNYRKVMYICELSEERSCT
jgi:hypothetical protein